MRYSKIQSGTNGKFILTSTACIGCGSSTSIELDDEARIKLEMGKNINEIAPELESGIAERFISGICPECWDTMVGEED